MSDTLLSFVGAMNGIPDNTSRLVAPQNAREAWLSLVPDRAGAYANPAAGPWTVPIAAVDTWTDIPLAIAADMIQSPAVLFWRMDANGQVGYDYAADWPDAVVPAGYTRSVALTAVIGLDPNGDTWEFAFAIDGVVQEPTELIETAGQTDAVTVTLVAGQGIDVSLAPRVSVQVKNNSNAGDLALLSFAYRANGGVLA